MTGTGSTFANLVSGIAGPTHLYTRTKKLSHTDRVHQRYQASVHRSAVFSRPTFTPRVASHKSTCINVCTRATHTSYRCGGRPAPSERGNGMLRQSARYLLSFKCRKLLVDRRAKISRLTSDASRLHASYASCQSSQE